jgi:LuxR family maltose regulon positive regulatory protein
MMDELEFAQQFAPSGPLTVNDIFRRQLATDWEAHEEARREREQAEAREAQRENMAMANRQMGDPLGNVTRCQMAVGEARDRVRALEDQLTEARRVLHRCADEYVTWSEQAEVVTATATDCQRYLADLTADGNHRWCAVDPRVGTARVVAEEGATPLRSPQRVSQPMLRRDPALAATYRHLLEPDLVRPAAARSQLPDGAGPAAPLIVERLSGREREVLKHVAAMLSTAEIAAEMYISVNTVKSHLRSVYRKLSATHRNEAVRRARQLELI